MGQTSQKIYLVVNKFGMPLMFTNPPTRTMTSWIGSFYINSHIYNDIVNLAKQSNLTFESEPEIIELNIETV